MIKSDLGILHYKYIYIGLQPEVTKERVRPLQKNKTDAEMHEQ